MLGIVGQPTVRDLAEVCSYLHLHTVRDVLVFLYARETLDKLALVGLVVQVTHLCEHPLRTFGVEDYLLACLQDG